MRICCVVICRVCICCVILRGVVMYVDCVIGRHLPGGYSPVVPCCVSMRSVIRCYVIICCVVSRCVVLCSVIICCVVMCRVI